MQNQTQIDARLEFARRVAEEAGQLTLTFFNSANLEVDRKADDSPVTIADREAEQLLRARVKDAFPDDAILGEEFGEEPGTSGYQWVFDPIDGTKSFICGVPLYTNLVAVLVDGEPQVGVINAPALQEMVYASRGGGAWHVVAGGGPAPAKCSPASSLTDGLFSTSQRDSYEERDAGEAYRSLEKAAQITRTWGDGYGYILVATGRALAMVDPIVSLWDVAPMPVVISEAGGFYSDWSGKPAPHGRDAVAVAPGVQQEVMSILQSFA